MVRRIILHIGMHKTGTSSIQASLAGFDDGTRVYADFEEANHSLPIYTAFSRGFESYHIWVKRGLTPEDIRARRTAYRARLERNLARDDRDTLILSGEDIGFLHPGDKAALIDALAAHAERIEVVCYVRAPASYAASITQQNIRGGGTTLPRAAPAAYVHRLRPFADRLPADAVTVRAFDRATLDGGSVVTDFCGLCGIDPAGLEERTTNESLSAPALKLILAFNRSNPCYFGDEIVFRARQALTHALAGLYAGGGAIDSARFACIADATGAEYLRDRFGIDFTAPAAAAGSIADLEAWLADLSDVDLGPLAADLARHGIAGRFETAEAMLNRLFYHLVHAETARQAPAALRPADGTLLRDAALTHEAGRPLTRTEAAGLLRLAARARPQGAAIRRKLEEWRQKG